MAKTKMIAATKRSHSHRMPRTGYVLPDDVIAISEAFKKISLGEAPKIVDNIRLDVVRDKFLTVLGKALRTIKLYPPHKRGLLLTLRSAAKGTSKDRK